MGSKKIFFFYFLFFSALNVSYAQQPKLMLPVGHTKVVKKAIYSPDKKYVLTLSEDETVKIWEAATGMLVLDINEPDEGIVVANYSADGQKIITGYSNGMVKIWDAVTGKLLVFLQGHTGSINAIEISADGKRILTCAEDSTARVWDAATLKTIFVLRENSKSLSAWYTPGCKKIITASLTDYGKNNGFTKIYDAESGNFITTFGVTNLRLIYVTPDDKKIIIHSWDMSLSIWDNENGRLLADVTEYHAYIKDLRFSKDSKKFVTANRNDDTVAIWNTETGKKISVDFKKPSKGIEAIGFSPDGKTLSISFNDSTITIFDAETGNAKLNIAATDIIKKNRFYLLFNPNGKTMLSISSPGLLEAWDVATGHLLFSDESSDRMGRFSDDGKQIILTCRNGYYGAKSIDAFTGATITDFKSKTHAIYYATPNTDRKRLLVQSDNEIFKIKDINTLQTLSTLKVQNSFKVAFSSDYSKYIDINSISNDSVEIRNVADGKLITVLEGLRDCSSINVAFTSDGKKVITACAAENVIKIFNAETGKLLKKLNSQAEQVVSIALSDDQKKIVSVGQEDTVRIWDAATGKQLVKFHGHTGTIHSTCFSPDGNYIVTTAEDSTARIWDAKTGKLVKKMIDNDSYYISSAQFSPDGKKILTVTLYNVMRIWDVQSGKLLNSIIEPLYDAYFIAGGKKILGVSANDCYKIWDAATGELLLSYFEFDHNDYLSVDKYNHYDGTADARKLLYFTCGTEVIELDQVKDQLWIPNLEQRVMKGETINAKTLNELDICGLTPEVKNISTNPGEYNFIISPRRGGLGETVLYVNGIEVKRYKPIELKQSAAAYELSIKKEALKNFFVSEKNNPVTVKAYTSDNAISSRGVKITGDTTKAATTPPNLYAVMVGISDYKGDELDLKFAAKDATDISSAVSNAAKKLLNTDGKEHVFMYNLTTAKEHDLLPEKSSIKKVLEEIGKKATANDVLLIFFAGHGIMEGEKKQFYFLTADASKMSATTAVADVGISTAELAEWMKPENIKAQKRILIFDACNSGQAINDMVVNQGQNYLAGRNDDKALQIRAIDKLNEKSGLFILCASASNQSAYEMGRYSQGLLTYSLLKAVKQQPDILEAGKYLDVSRWFNAAQKTVSDVSKENGARQEPQIVTNTNFNIGIVDAEVIAKIRLAQEKPLFTASNFQNADDNVMADDLGFNKIVDQKLNEISSRDGEETITYAAASNSPDGYTLSGRYVVTGNTIKVKIIIRQNNAIKKQFELTGKKDALNDLAATLVEQSAKLVK